MDELGKCMAGEYYDCHDEVFLEFKCTARRLLAQYHALAYEQKKEKTEILRKLFGGMGTNVSVGVPFICDYGRNIYVGSNVLIASNVQLYTATHPVELSQRLTPDWNPESGEYFCRTYARPIKIGNGCWLGGGVIILPGVTIGDGCVIGGGSVVTKDIPPNSLAVGNPCRVIRKINEEARNGSVPEPL